MIKNSCLIFILIFSCSNAFAQKKMCNNQDFQITVDKYIDYKIPVITTDEFYDDWDQYIILDAREIEEYEVSHIPGAIRVGYDNPDFSALDDIHKDKKILIYCSIGYRSEKIGKKLNDQGYSDIHNLYGSIFEWANDGYPLEDMNEETTNKVHGYNKNWSQWIENNNIEKVY